MATKLIEDDNRWTRFDKDELFVLRRVLLKASGKIEDIGTAMLIEVIQEQKNRASVK